MEALCGLTALIAQHLICRCLILWAEGPLSVPVLPPASWAASTALMPSASSLADGLPPVSPPVCPHRDNHSSFYFMEALCGHPARSAQSLTCLSLCARYDLALSLHRPKPHGPSPGLRRGVRISELHDLRSTPGAPILAFGSAPHTGAGGGMCGRGHMSLRPQDCVPD
ncbi:hypothetical protein NDU88_001475 [Pleurodeles waltl]|uniref:Uncharacterized protein n=1 Tax=Pleurodeles waltl TaxID=8319 RepID=A0AAV7KR25_PLEWA|nr:hypothetical protein NDU88_001475 [Pleurodeles waltl]